MSRGCMVAMRRHRQRPVAVLSLLLACCTDGGDGGARAGATATPPSVAFADQVDAACAGLAAQVADIVRETIQRPAPDQAPSADKLRAAADRVAAAVGKVLTAVRAMTPPAADRTIVASMLAAFDAGVAALRANPAAIESIGTEKAGDPFAKADRKAIGYGAERCALSSAAEGGD